MGPSAGLEGCWKHRPPPVFDPRTLQPVARRFTIWAIPAHGKKRYGWKDLRLSLFCLPLCSLPANYHDYQTKPKMLSLLNFFSRLTTTYLWTAYLGERRRRVCYRIRRSISTDFWSWSVCGTCFPASVKVYTLWSKISVPCEDANEIYIWECNVPSFNINKFYCSRRFGFQYCICKVRSVISYDVIPSLLYEIL